MNYKTLWEKLEFINVITSNGQINKQVKWILNQWPDIKNDLWNATSFLQWIPSNSSSEERIRIICVRDQITEQPKCKTCGSFTTFNRVKNRFNFYCNSKCSHQDPSIQNHYQQVFDQQRTEINNKRQQTMKERYGGTAPIHDPQVKQKILNNRTMPDSGKRKQTMKERYGANTWAESQIEPNTLAILQDYNVFKQYYIDCGLNKQKIANLLTVSTYTIRRYVALYNLDEYLKNHSMWFKTIKHANDKFLDDPQTSTEHLKNYQWLQFLLEHKSVPVGLLAEYLNCTVSHVYRWKNYHQLQSVTSKHSIPEQAIVSLLKQNEQLTIQQNVYDRIPPYELDIVIPELNLAIEYNGVYWHGELSGKHKQYHLNKTKMCEQVGLRLIQIWDYEWSFKQRIVRSRLNNLANVQHIEKIYARNTDVVQMTSSQNRRFFDDNHLQGSQSAQVAYGLVYNDQIVAAMSFSIPRFNTKCQWELIRFATKQNVSVIGGASKLFKHFVRQNDPTSVISYSDKRWNTGELYKQLKFEWSHSSQPNYFYFKTKNVDKLYSRNNFQKHKLPDKLEHFDKNLTEWQNMINNGYDRIWDCGNDVYIWTSN